MYSYYYSELVDTEAHAEGTGESLIQPNSQTYSIFNG